MRKFLFAPVIAFALMLALSACATLGNGQLDVSASAEIPVKYATLKVIEDSDGITGAAVIEHVQRVRSLVEDNATVNIASLVEQVREPINWDALSMSDRLLLDALISQIEYSARGTDVVGEERRVRILTLLDWVEQAARLAR